MGGPRCPPAICDCFIDLYPDDPMGLHPEAFTVMVPCDFCGGIGLIGGRTCQHCGRDRINDNGPPAVPTD